MRIEAQSMPIGFKEDPRFSGVGISNVPRDVDLENADFLRMQEQSGTKESPYWEYYGNPRVRILVARNREGAEKGSPMVTTEQLFGKRSIGDLALSSRVDSPFLRVVAKLSSPYTTEGPNFMVVFDAEKEDKIPRNIGDLQSDELVAFHEFLLASFEELSLKGKDTTNEKSAQELTVAGMNSGNDFKMLIPVVDPATGEIHDIYSPKSNPTQSLERAHVHFVRFQINNEERQKFKSLPKEDRRKLYEPLLPYSMELFDELVFKPVEASFPTLMKSIEVYMNTTVSDKDSEFGTFPKGCILRFPKEKLKEEQFAQFLIALQQQAATEYEDLMGAVVDKRAYHDGYIIPLDIKKGMAKLDTILSQEKYATLDRDTKKLLRKYILSVPFTMQRLLEEDTGRNEMIQQFPELEGQFFFTDPRKVMEAVNSMGNLFGPNYHLVYTEDSSDPDMINIILLPWLYEGHPWNGAVGILKQAHVIQSQEEQEAFNMQTDENVEAVRSLLSAIASHPNQQGMIQ